MLGRCVARPRFGDGSVNGKRGWPTEMTTGVSVFSRPASQWSRCWLNGSPLVDPRNVTNPRKQLFEELAL
jgi:hypothetical protein